MSFTMEVKEELTRVAPGCATCDRAMLSALVRVEGTLVLQGNRQYALEIDTEIPSVARFVIKQLHARYQLRTEWTLRRNVLHKVPNYLITVPNQPNMKRALKDLGVLGERGLESGIRQDLVAKNCCAAAYLRGVFLGSGFVSNPRGDFHFEMTIENEALAHDVVALMQSKGINARMMPRRHSFLIYMKSGGAILSFLALVGAHQGALYMENQRVVKSVRNDVNRKVNAELANLDKASAAGQSQLAAIKRVVEHYGMENLSPALQSFIKLRVANPMASMKELGELANPPLSKSAVAHRVRRLQEMDAAIRQDS